MKRTLKAAFVALSIAWSIMAFGQSKPVPLAFNKMLFPTSRGLTLSLELQQLAGKRVVLEGFMALLEKPPAGGFWLCPSPVFQDESGAGSGDLPPNAVFVVVRGAGKKPVAHLFGKLSVSGVLSLKSTSPRIVVTLDSETDADRNPTKGRNNR